MFGSPSLRMLFTKLVAAITVLATGGSGGALLGIVSEHPSVAKQAASSPQLREAHAEIGSLEVTESPQPSVAQPAPAPAQTPVQKRVKRVQSAPSLTTTAGTGSVTGLQVPTFTGSSDCDRLTDRMIEWTRRLVAKTRDANPGSDAIAARVDAHLAGGLGANVCAAEAQRHLSNFCSDPAVFDFMQKMVNELPFFVRPLVGDPCKHDLVKVAQKYLP